MHYIHKVGCTSVRQVPVTGTCSFRLTTHIWRDLCLSETQIHRSSDLWVSHGYTCVDPQVTQTHAQPYIELILHSTAGFNGTKFHAPIYIPPKYPSPILLHYISAGHRVYEKQNSPGRHSWSLGRGGY